MRTSKRRRIGELPSRGVTAESAAAELETLLRTWKLGDNATFAIVDLSRIA